MMGLLEANQAKKESKSMSETIVSQSDGDRQFVVRWELQEKQCRRFEQLIAQACVVGSQEIDATTIKEKIGGKGKGMSARTLTARLNDAILGFKRYKYSSRLIPIGFNLNNLQAREMAGEKVFLQNKVSEFTTQMQREATPVAADKAKTLFAIKAHIKDAPKATEIKYSSQEELDWILETLKMERPDLKTEEEVGPEKTNIMISNEIMLVKLL